MRLTVIGGALIDGSGMEPRNGATLTLEAGRVTGISSGRPAGTPGSVVDARGLTLLPGLIDLHTHLGIVAATGQEQLPAAVVAAEVFRNLQLALDSGFTTVRDCGGLDGGVQEALRRGLVQGPRIFPSGPILCQTGGHGDIRTPFDPHDLPSGTPGLSRICVVADGADGVRRAAREAFRRGATQLKVCVSGGVISRSDAVSDVQYTVDELAAAVEEAENRGTYVTAHAMNLESVRLGLQAGIACFEHVPVLDRATAVLLRNAGAAFVSTLSVARLMSVESQQWGIPLEVLPRLEGLVESGAAALKTAHELGVLVGSGSDLLGPSQNRRGLEVALMAEILGPMAAITTATASNARILRRSAELGRIAVGAIADVIGVEGDPLVNPELFDDPARVRLVVQDGQVVKNTT